MILARRVVKGFISPIEGVLLILEARGKIEHMVGNGVLNGGNTTCWNLIQPRLSSASHSAYPQQNGAQVVCTMAMGCTLLTETRCVARKSRLCSASGGVNMSLGRKPAARKKWVKYWRNYRYLNKLSRLRTATMKLRHPMLPKGQRRSAGPTLKKWL